MTRTHHLTEKKGKIVGMAAAGMTHKSIVTRLGLVRSTVSSIVAREATRGTVATAARSGRPCKATERDLRHLQTVLQANPRMKIAEATDQLPTAVSTRTTRRRAHDLGFNSRVAVKKPFVNDTHRERRLQFAEDHAHWTMDDWRAVLWTDESSFEIGKPSRQIKVWRGKKAKFDPKNLVPTFKSG